MVPFSVIASREIPILNFPLTIFSIYSNDSSLNTKDTKVHEGKPD